MANLSESDRSTIHGNKAVTSPGDRVWLFFFNLISFSSRFRSCQRGSDPTKRGFHEDDGGKDEAPESPSKRPRVGTVGSKRVEGGVPRVDTVEVLIFISIK